MAALEGYKAMEPWFFPEISDAFTLSGREGTVLADAELKEAGPRRSGEPPKYLLSGRSVEGADVSIELSAVAAYALHEHVTGTAAP